MRLEGWGGPMVRDGASRPPHHEAGRGRKTDLRSVIRDCLQSGGLRLRLTRATSVYSYPVLDFIRPPARYAG